MTNPTTVTDADVDRAARLRSSRLVRVEDAILALEVAFLNDPAVDADVVLAVENDLRSASLAARRGYEHARRGQYDAVLGQAKRFREAMARVDGSLGR